jgi:uncharacterized lipoprotein YmbA
MKKMIPLCLSGILILGLTGCITPAPGPRSQFYQLQPIVEEVSAGAEATDGPVVHIGPVQVSEYLNQPQMVSRIGKHQVAYDELKRWAEPLNDNILWVLTKNIHDELPEARVVPFTGLPNLYKVTTLSVPIRISRMETRPDGTVLLQAGWMVIPQKTDVGATPVSVAFTKAAASGSTEDLVAAQSELIRELSERIVQDIQTALKSVSPEDS